jgi:hypothetical protein
MSATSGTFSWTDDQGVVHSLDRPNLRARTLTNLYSVPPLRGEDVPIASYPGEVWLEKQHSPRRIDLELLMYDQTGGSVFGIIQELAQAFGIHNQGTLTHFRPDGTTVSASAQVNGWTSKRSNAGPWNPVQQGLMVIWYLAVVPFTLTDPYFYGPPITVTSDISGGSAVQSLTHPGTVRGHKPVFTFAGPCLNPGIVNAANSVSVQCLVTVPSGQSLIIDSGAWTAALNGVSVIGSIVHAGAFPFMFLEPGPNALTASGGTGSPATITTTFAPPWF